MTKPTRAQALRQVLRFANYPNFPDAEKRQSDQEELVFAFQDAAADAEHLVEIGDWLIRKRPVPDCRFCPVPGEVYAAAGNLRPEGRVVDTYENTGPRPGDEPFNGLSDLIDDKLISILERKVAKGGTHAERESLQRFILARKNRDTQPKRIGAGK